MSSPLNAQPPACRLDASWIGGRRALGRGRGYEFQDYLDDCAHAGLEVQVGLSTWDLRPFDADSDFLVTVLGRA